MKLLLTKLENIALTIITILLTLYPSCLILLVRVGDYIVNLCDFYSYKLIGQPTAFLQLQEFSLRNMTVTSSTTAAQRSPSNWNLSVAIFSVCRVWSCRHRFVITCFQWHSVIKKDKGCVKKECKKFSFHLIQAHERNVLRAWLSGFMKPGSVHWFTRTSSSFQTYFGHRMLSWASPTFILRPCYLRDTSRYT